MKLLGIGSRIEHDELGFGVVTNITSKHYWVSFQKSGIETIDIDDTFEVIEACEDDVDTVSFYERFYRCCCITTYCFYSIETYV